MTIKTTEIKIVEALIKAYEKNPKKWIQGKSKKRVGNLLSFCLLGGIHHFSKKIATPDTRINCMHNIEHLLNNEIPVSHRTFRTFVGSKERSYILWNDKKGRKISQVINLLKKVHKKLIKLSHQTA